MANKTREFNKDRDIFSPYSRSEFVYRGLDLNISVSKFEYSISDIVSVFEYLNRIFTMSTSNRILSNMVDIICI